MERIVDFHLLGQTVSLRTDLPEEMVAEIQRLLQEKEEEIRRKYRFLPPLKVAILLLLQISGDYVKMKKDYEAFREALLEKASQIDEYLEREKGSLGCS